MATLQDDFRVLNQLMAREIEAELYAIDTGVRKFAASGVKDPQLLAALNKIVEQLRQANVELHAGKTAAEQAFKSIPDENRVSLNPQFRTLIKKLYEDFQFLRDPAHSNFKDQDLVALHAILVPSDNMDETRLLNKILQTHKNLQKNLPHELQNLVNKAPAQLKDALMKLKIKTSIGPYEYRQIADWYSAQGGLLEGLFQDVQAKFNAIDGKTKGAFIESLRDPSKQRMFRGGAMLITDYIARYPEGQNLIKSLRAMRGAMVLYERNYFQMYALLGEIMNRIELFYTKPDEFAKLPK